jgi:2-keto-4-pentenoate hydratase/2-oxohepta-3-ene-1,7-dioic acid hydratase in catechol pathway
MHAIDLNTVRILPPVPKPPKILRVGLNYDDHLAESGLKKPVYRAAQIKLARLPALQHH